MIRKHGLISDIVIGINVGTREPERKGKMNKIANVVYSGWMVKSPPEKKFRLTGAWKIFRAVSVFVFT